MYNNFVLNDLAVLLSKLMIGKFFCFLMEVRQIVRENYTENKKQNKTKPEHRSIVQSSQLVLQGLLYYSMK